MPVVVRAYPLRRAVEDLQKLADSLSTEKKAETDLFYKQYGVAHESWHVQETPLGPWVIGLTILDEVPDTASRYAAASESFHAWFKEQILDVTGVDPSKTPLGPPTTQVFAWSDENRAELKILFSDGPPA